MAQARRIDLPTRAAARARLSEGFSGRLASLLARLRSSWAVPAGLAAAAGLALGLFVAASSPPLALAPDAPGWRMSAAIYHRLYTAETFAIAPQAETEIDAGVRAVAQKLRIDLSRLSAPEGLSLERAQLLSFNGRDLAQIAFLDTGGAPIALCVMRRKADAASSAKDAPQFAASMLLDLNAVDWSDESHDFLLIGAAPPEALDAYAKRFAEQLG